MEQQGLALSIKNLSKDFLLPHERKSSLKEWILHFKKPSYEKFHVLHDINLEVKRGEFFGIVGRNGSGKSTLLKIIGGIYQPTQGQVHVNGTLTPFIELGIGFNPELTGRENVFLNGAILGLTRKEVKQKYTEIVAFAELERFMDQKLKNYSSGMQVRLAFSIAIQAHNDILLIDEVLAVGDAAFQRKCYNTFKEIKRSGKTVIFVTHDMGAVREFCDRAMLIDDSKIVSSGAPDKIANNYVQLFNKAEEGSELNKNSSRWGDQQASISDLEVKPGKENIKISYKLTAKKDIKDPIMGVIIRDLDGHPLFDSNTKWKHIKTGELSTDEQIHITWDIPNSFKSGQYKVSVAAAHEDGYGFYDWQDDIAKFDVTRPEETAALVLLNDKITIKRPK